MIPSDDLYRAVSGHLLIRLGLWFYFGDQYIFD